MTALEIHDMLGTYLNTYEVGFQRDIYQESLYMTRAQDIYYDAILQAFEETNFVSEQIDRLMLTQNITMFTSGMYGGLIATFPVYARKILRERVQFTDNEDTIPIYRGDTMQVREERLSEIESSLNNPFRKPGEHYVLRSVQESTSFNKVALYIPEGTEIANYTNTLAIEPKPIVLETLPNDLEIRGFSDETATFEFKDKDIEKIIEIAVGLILKDAGAFGERARQGIEAIGEGIPEYSAEALLKAMDNELAQSPRSHKYADENHPMVAERLIKGMADEAASAPKRLKIAETKPDRVGEKVVSAIDAVLASTPRSRKVADENPVMNAEKAMEFLDNKVAQTPKRLKVAEDKPDRIGEKVIDLLDNKATQTPKRVKLAEDKPTLNAEKVLGAIDAYNANAPKSGKAETERPKFITEHTLSALEQQLLSQPKK